MPLFGFLETLKRKELDKNGYEKIQILSYAVKYSSSFYGPFRDALGSKLDKNKIDGKQTYQKQQ